MRIKGVLFDLGGVLHVGTEPLAGAIEAVKLARESGLATRFLSNTSRRTRASLLAMLQKLGFELTAEEVFTAPLAARAHVETNDLRPQLLIHPDLGPDFANLNVDDPNAVLIGDAGEYFNYERLNRAFRLLKTGAPLLAVGKNPYFREPDGLSMDVGGFVSALEYAAGCEAVVLGKPAKRFFLTAGEDMGLSAEQIVMIGDDVDADVLGAWHAGISAILVKTGKFQPADVERIPASHAACADNLIEAVEFILADRLE